MAGGEKKVPTDSTAPASPGFVIVGAMSLVKMVRRVLTAIGGAALIAGVLRVRGKGGVPPQTGGWRELRDLDDS